MLEVWRGVRRRSLRRRRVRRPNWVGKVTPSAAARTAPQRGRRGRGLADDDRARRRRVAPGRRRRNTDVILQSRRWPRCSLSGQSRRRGAGRGRRFHRASSRTGWRPANGCKLTPRDLRMYFTPRPMTRCHTTTIRAAGFTNVPRAAGPADRANVIFSQSNCSERFFNILWSPGILSHDLCAGLLCDSLSEEASTPPSAQRRRLVGVFLKGRRMVPPPNLHAPGTRPGDLRAHRDAGCC